jgi:hypothetical protein
MRYDYVHLTPNAREYDSKWSDAARPNGHEPHIKQIDREIKNIEDEINKTCK